MNRKGLVGIILVIVLALVAMWGIGWVMWFAGGTGEVVKQEFHPKELLRKYEWFKDTSAQLDKKIADITVYQARVNDLIGMYEGIHRKDWPKDEREQVSQWKTEVAGVIASYNLLAADYNAQMAKMNWRFTNIGMLPEGATETLPREFRQYKTG